MVAFSLAAAASFTALFGSVAGQLSIITPGGPNLWWVAKSTNTLAWTCSTSPYTNYTILIANSNPTILTAPIAFIAQEENYICSQTVTPDQVNQTPATGYTIQFADPFNETNVYEETQPFEIKALGATYPPASATPTASGTSTASSAGSSSSSSSTSKKSNASALEASIAFGFAVAAAAVGFVSI